MTAVIVTYQSARTIGRTLAAARRGHDEQLLDTIVVDNNSSDDTCAIVAKEDGWLRFIPTGTNNGFGRGCNVGIARVTSPYTIFINPDAVVEPDAIRSMLRFMDTHPKAGIVGPATICREDAGIPALQHASERPTPWTVILNSIPHTGTRPKSRAIEPGSAPFRTEWICGAVMMVRTNLLKQLAGFDPRFFLYWEETDLCKRAEEAGFEIWALGTALARHVVGESSSTDKHRSGNDIALHHYQSRYYYMTKHHGIAAATLAELVEFAFLVLRSLADAARGRGLSRLRIRTQAPLLSMPAQVPDDH